MPWLNEQKKKEILGKCQEALLSIAPEYFQATLPTEATMYSERMFAYEFYHQIRLRFQDEIWYVNGEFRKGLYLAGVQFEQDTVIPDIVLHRSDTLKENIAVFEIKVAPNTSTSALLHDLRKLGMYTKSDNGLNFTFGALIVANQSFREVYGNAAPTEKDEIRNLIENYPRIAVWNIPIPICSQTGSSVRLTQESLEIFRIGHELFSSP